MSRLALLPYWRCSYRALLARPASQARRIVHQKVLAVHLLASWNWRSVNMAAATCLCECINRKWQTCPAWRSSLFQSQLQPTAWHSSMQSEPRCALVSNLSSAHSRMSWMYLTATSRNETAGSSARQMRSFYNYFTVLIGQFFLFEIAVYLENHSNFHYDLFFDLMNRANLSTVSSMLKPLMSYNKRELMSQ